MNTGLHCVGDRRSRSSAQPLVLLYARQRRGHQQGGWTAVLLSPPRRGLHSTPSRGHSAPHPLHLDDAGAEVLALLRAHFDDCKGMRMVAMYGSGAFKQISETEGSPVAPAVPSTAAAAVAATTSAEAPMLDLIFAVDDPVAFHLTNMRRHPSHYSFLRHLAWLSPSLIGRIQEWSAGVWYNTLIDLPIVAAPSATAAPGVPATRLIKYGVISTKRLVQDLTTWDALYIAGRMHKPMHMLICEPAIQAAANSNLRSALATAVLLLDGSAEQQQQPQQPQQEQTPVAETSPLPSPSNAAPSSAPSTFTVSLRSLLQRIASLSYLGDIRMGVAENPHKVANIVSGSWAQLVELYREHIERIAVRPNVKQQPPQRFSKPLDMMQLPCDIESRASLLASLPAHFQRQIRLHDSEAVGAAASAIVVPSSLTAAVASSPEAARAAASSYWHNVAHRPGAARSALLSGALGAIVARSSKQQTLKGLATAGVRKSLRYGLAKFKKAMMRK